MEWLLVVIALVVILFLKKLVIGQFRANKIASHYGLPKQVIIDAYAEHCKLARVIGLPPTVRNFEVELRKGLAEFNPYTKDIDPIYCADLDPLKEENA